jgi:GTPase SAR1 family protein
MLRQIHIYKKDERVFTYTFALSLGTEDLENLFEVIESNTNMRVAGKTLHRTLSEYQVFHRSSQDYYFILITDLIDKLDYIEDIFEKLIKKFEEHFPTLEKLAQSEDRREEFIEYLYDLQAELHSKISIIGPMGAGKTTLYKMLTDRKKERNIMNFAKSSILSLYELKFDVWDFQINDNYALLWSKFVSGSDLVIFVIDASNINLKILKNFVDLKKKEGNLSKSIVIANKMDLVSDDNVVASLEKDLNLSNILPITLENSDAKEKVFSRISNVLKIKKKIPDEYEDLLKEAQKIEETKNWGKTIAKYKELIRYLNKYQDFNEINKLTEKVKDLEKKLKRQAEIRKKIEMKKKFAPPSQIKFDKKVKVKSFSKARGKPRVDGVPSKNSSEKVEHEDPKEPLSEIKTPQPEKPGLKLKASDIKINLSVLRNTQQKIKSKIHSKESLTDANKEQDEQKPEEKYDSIDDVPDKAVLLQEMIESRGSSLSLKLCNQFIKEMDESLDRDINLNDLKVAADNFLSLESQR